MTWSFKEDFNFSSILKGFVKRHHIFLKALIIISFFVMAQFSLIASYALCALVLTFFLTIPLYYYYKEGRNPVLKKLALFFFVSSFLLSIFFIFSALVVILSHLVFQE